MKLIVLLIVWCVVLAISGVIGGFTWPYTIGVAAALMGKTVVVSYWKGFVLGCVPGIGQLSIPGAAIAWIVGMLFL